MDSGSTKNLNPDTFAFLMGFTGMSAVMASTMYLPMFPEMVTDFGTTKTLMKLTMTALLVGAIFGKLFNALASGVVGERALLLSFITMFLLGSIGCAMAFSIEMFFLTRFIQGIGVAGAPVIVRALAGEDFQGKVYFKVIATIVFMMTIAPGLAPFFGSHIGHLLGWQAIFYTLSFMGLISWLIACFYVYKPTSSSEKSSSIFFQITQILHNRKFIYHMLLAALSYAQIYVFSSLSSFLFRTELGWTLHEFSWVGVGLAGGCAAGALLVRFLVENCTLLSILKYCRFPMYLVSLTLLLLSFTSIASGNIVLLGVIIYFTCVGMLTSVAIGGAVKSIKVSKELGSSIVGLILVAASSIGTGLCSFMPDDLFNVSLVLLVTPIGIHIVHVFFTKDLHSDPA